PNSPAELAALGPLIDRGVVIVAQEIDGSQASSTTAYVHVNAPPAVVREVIADPRRYGEIMPWVVGATELSHRSGRAAYGLHLRVASFDVDAVLTLRSVGTDTIEATVRQEAVGQGHARWQVLPDADGGTVVRLVVRTALERESFLVRLATGLSPAAYTFGNV